MGNGALLLCFFLIAVAPSVFSCPPSDRAALLAFKAALNEPYLGIFESWTGSDCCHDWFGVSCDPTNSRVADINLRGECEDPIFQRAHRSGGYMSGQISPEICNLDRLSNLVVADWKGISGPIPACVTSLPFLRVLDVVGNSISGPLPPDIGNLSRLTVLNVADNQISGRIPPLHHPPRSPHAPRPPQQPHLRRAPRRPRQAEDA
ncbi:hypothetical protein ACLOJK_018332 [Asimina triloba]